MLEESHAGFAREFRVLLDAAAELEGLLDLQEIEQAYSSPQGLRMASLLRVFLRSLNLTVEEALAYMRASENLVALYAAHTGNKAPPQESAL